MNNFSNYYDNFCFPIRTPEGEVPVSTNIFILTSVMLSSQSDISFTREGSLNVGPQNRPGPELAFDQMLAEKIN